MTDTPWTPGPWWVSRQSVEFWGLPIAAGDQDAEYPELICGFDDDDAEVGANARLIMQAPALYAALEAVTGWLEGTEAYMQNHGVHSDAVEARKVMARARGDA